MVTNRVAVVTGANKGIGYFIALQLGLSGKFSDVILGCRDATRGANAMQEIQGQIDQKLSHVKVHSLPLEIGNDASQNEFCQRMQEEFGGSLDVLVNNAGMVRPSLVTKTDVRVWEEHLKVNLTGAFLCALKVLPGMPRLLLKIHCLCPKGYHQKKLIERNLESWRVK